MKRNLLLIAFLAAIVATLAVNAARLGTLTSDSTVWTTTEDIVAPGVTTGAGFPVFEIRVPDGYVEVQVRASLTNFEPGFLLKDGADFVLNYIPTGAVVAGRKVYKALGADHVATWNAGTSRWTFGYKSIYSTNTAIAPWDIPGNTLTGTPAGTFALQKEIFVYRFCTTGIPSDAQWGTGSGDPDAWVYIANQSATTGVPGSEFIRQKWSDASSLQAQLQPGGTPGYTILFQPSRGNLGAVEWMQQNHDKLVWIYQVQDGGGIKPTHPNGADVWNSLYPHEWRKARITLTAP